jgi:DedD protein
MATRSDAPEPQVDELRRRARRRLVGAVVLALAAAVLLPLLLESEPKPLGDDVSIQIPPIDSGKFINPLSSGKAPDPKVKGGTAASKSTAELPAPSSAVAPPAPLPAPKQGAVGSETPASGPPPPMPTPAPPAPTVSTQAAPSQVAAKPVPDATTEVPAPTPAAKVDAAATGAAYVVQVAAFSDHYGASSLANKLKRSGFPGYTEAVTTDKGTTLHRVRVGPYVSREAADAALVKLKAAGFSGMVAHVG